MDADDSPAAKEFTVGEWTDKCYRTEKLHARESSAALNELRVTRSVEIAEISLGWEGEGKGGTGARQSCKNFVREECKQCPVRVARLFPSHPSIFYSPLFLPAFVRASIVFLVEIRVLHPRRPSFLLLRARGKPHRAITPS